MAIFEILKYPNPVLRQISEPVTVFDQDLADLASDMAETMLAAPGAGLAAPQVGKPVRLIVIDNSSDEEDHGTRVLPLVNPEIVESDGSQIFEEGCLSVDELKANVSRANFIRVEAQDLEGRPIDLEFEGRRAVILQHEIDHLKGILFIDHLSLLKRTMYEKHVSKKLKKQEKEK
ncbi:MAG: peptide deformylase [Deltaproteobacteria bacterium]|jgi:peptide deformylase|nr:peptide deformylase [Deltaproteobacteria bacterium]